jgi:hypothetical protein
MVYHPEFFSPFMYSKEGLTIAGQCIHIRPGFPENRKKTDLRIRSDYKKGHTAEGSCPGTAYSIIMYILSYRYVIYFKPLSPKTYMKIGFFNRGIVQEQKNIKKIKSEFYRCPIMTANFFCFSAITSKY